MQACLEELLSNLPDTVQQPPEVPDFETGHPSHHDLQTFFAEHPIPAQPLNRATNFPSSFSVDDLKLCTTEWRQIFLEAKREFDISTPSTNWWMNVNDRRLKARSIIYSRVLARRHQRRNDNWEPEYGKFVPLSKHLLIQL